MFIIFHIQIQRFHRTLGVVYSGILFSIKDFLTLEVSTSINSYLFLFLCKFSDAFVDFILALIFLGIFMNVDVLILISPPSP